MRYLKIIQLHSMCKASFAVWRLFFYLPTLFPPATLVTIVLNHKCEYVLTFNPVSLDCELGGLQSPRPIEACGSSVLSFFLKVLTNFFCTLLTLLLYHSFWALWPTCICREKKLKSLSQVFLFKKSSTCSLEAYLKAPEHLLKPWLVMFSG